MKNIILSAGGPLRVYSVPDKIADSLEPTGLTPVGFGLVRVFHIEHIGSFVSNAFVGFVNHIDLIVC